MINITIVGAGSYGSKIAEKYQKFSDVSIKAVVSHSRPKSAPLSEISLVSSATEWKKKFKIPGENDVFDICVHQNILVDVLKDFVKIGAKNFILPKPIALNKKELEEVQNIASRFSLKIAISSQWHYSGLLKEISKFIRENKDKISSISVVFSRTFDSVRSNKYTSKTAFLPHIVQILNDLRLINEKSKAVTDDISDKKIKINYSGKYAITAESDLTLLNKEEYLKIFLKNKKDPALIADFSGISGPYGFVKYPSITVYGKETQICEDILEKMIKCNINYFSSSLNLNKNILTLDKYLPVAKEVVNIANRSPQTVGVIGGGVFGVLSALEIAKKGHPVIIFEKESEIIKGASLVNQCRVHMGYHYPRDERTAKHSLSSKGLFEELFGPKVVREIKNYYMVAKEGSLTSPKNFLKFCKKMNLPFKISWPVGFVMNKENIATSFNVPEKIFDANRKRDFLNKQIASLPNIKLLVSTKVTNLKRIENGFEVEYESNGVKSSTNCSSIINATYGAINYINNFLNLPLQTFQYELCEVPVVETDWNGSGWSVIDGPFFGIMPFGFSKNYLFYDVELSVLERVVGKFADFKNTIDYYDNKKRKAERFMKYKEKWRKWFGEVDKCRHIYSMYVIRIVLPNKEKTDARPTTLNELLPGYWQVFSGKITNSVSAAIELSNKIDKFLKKKRR